MSGQDAADAADAQDSAAEADGQAAAADGQSPDGLLESARAWLAQDPDGETRTELREIIASAEEGDDLALANLTDRFGSRLDFGTAGLRGELGAGTNRMNRVLVAQAAAAMISRSSVRVSPSGSWASQACAESSSPSAAAAASWPFTARRSHERAARRSRVRRCVQTRAPRHD